MTRTPETRVLKVGGRVQGDAALPAAIAAAVGAGDRVVVVHGGGDEISALQRALGHEPKFVGGRRTTTREELDAVRMVLSGTANKRLVAACRAAGVRAVGISGEDGGLLSAHVAPGAPLGRVGERVTADVTLLRDLLDAGWVPVVSPLGTDADDSACSGLNVNGDDAAAAIAAALAADELVFVADIPGVLVDGHVMAQLTPVDATVLISRGVAAGGMAAKLQAACAALAHGVNRVRIAPVDAIAGDSQGTTIQSPSPVTPWPR